MKNKRIIKGKKAWTGVLLFNSPWAWCRPVNSRFIFRKPIYWINFLLFGIKKENGAFEFRFFNKKLRLVYR